MEDWTNYVTFLIFHQKTLSLVRSTSFTLIDSPEVVYTRMYINVSNSSKAPLAIRRPLGSLAPAPLRTDLGTKLRPYAGPWALGLGQFGTKLSDLVYTLAPRLLGLTSWPPDAKHRGQI